MKKQVIVDNLQTLGSFFKELEQEDSNQLGDEWKELIKQGRSLRSTVAANNPWFTEEYVKLAFGAWAQTLQKEKIENWIASYELPTASPKKVGVIMAGNIPMVGLHDALSVLVSGHHLVAKLSSKDDRLMKLILEALAQIDSNWKERITVNDRMNEADLMIATGTDNSARYYEYYFKDKPKIIRKNRTAVAVLSEDIGEKELDGLADDVFTYFGLGCRNITKVYVPKDFELDRIFQSFFKYKEIINHHQYANNYDYNKAVYLMNSIDLVENGFILLKEDEGLHSPLGVLFYERYEDLSEVKKKLIEQEEEIQLISSDLNDPKFKKLGEAQYPDLLDYADGVDTLQFLVEN